MQARVLHVPRFSGSWPDSHDQNIPGTTTWIWHFVENTALRDRFSREECIGPYWATGKIEFEAMGPWHARHYTEKTGPGQVNCFHAFKSLPRGQWWLRTTSWFSTLLYQQVAYYYAWVHIYICVLRTSVLLLTVSFPVRLGPTVALCPNEQIPCL